MILGAGRGERLRPLTDSTPKPLLAVGGKPLVVRHLERLAAAGVRDVVINLGHLGEALVAVLGDGRSWGLRIRYSDERDGVLETGGGIVRALPLLGEGPFLLVNGDVYTDYPMERLLEEKPSPAWLVLVPNPAHHPGGDFALTPSGTLAFDGPARYTYGGMARLRGALFAGLPDDRWPLAWALTRWVGEGLAGGELYAGAWVDVGTPQRLAEAEALAVREESHAV